MCSSDLALVRSDAQLAPRRRRLAQPGTARHPARRPWGRRRAPPQSWRRRPHGRPPAARSMNQSQAATTLTNTGPDKARISKPEVALSSLDGRQRSCRQRRAIPSQKLMIAEGHSRQGEHGVVRNHTSPWRRTRMNDLASDRKYQALIPIISLFMIRWQSLTPS